MLPLFPSSCSGRPILPHRPANNGKRFARCTFERMSRLAAVVSCLAAFLSGAVAVLLVNRWHVLPDGTAGHIVRGALVVALTALLPHWAVEAVDRVIARLYLPLAGAHIEGF